MLTAMVYPYPSHYYREVMQPVNLALVNVEIFSRGDLLRLPTQSDSILWFCSVVAIVSLNLVHF